MDEGDGQAGVRDPRDGFVPLDQDRVVLVDPDDGPGAPGVILANDSCVVVHEIILPRPLLVFHQEETEVGWRLGVLDEGETTF